MTLVTITQLQASTNVHKEHGFQSFLFSDQTLA
jgi:hypothetical protein